MFNILTTTVTRTLIDGIYGDLCDFSMICFADDILLISSSLFTLQVNLNCMISGCKHLELRVNAAKTEFFFLQCPG